jgi:hypothetical protein
MTDSDNKERIALRNVWPDIELLMCKYHFSKASSSHMIRTLGNGGDSEQKAYRGHMKAFILQFRTRYVRSSISAVFVLVCHL